MSGPDHYAVGPAFAPAAGMPRHGFEKLLSGGIQRLLTACAGGEIVAMPAAPHKGNLHIIIDGYNLIRKIPALSRYEGRSLQDGRDHLIARAAAYRAATGYWVTVVFDGPSPSMDSHRGVTLCYARPADDAIVRMAGPGCVIVSSDRAVADGARARGAEAMRSEEFWDAATTNHPGVAAPSRRGQRKSASSTNQSGGWDKDGDDDEPQRPDKRGPSKRLSRSEREAEERRRRLRNLM